eukprot:scaffold661_cov100-Skeletonema_menzelii.AAC.3
MVKGKGCVESAWQVAKVAIDWRWFGHCIYPSSADLCSRWIFISFKQIADLLKELGVPPKWNTILHGN